MRFREQTNSTSRRFLSLVAVCLSLHGLPLTGAEPETDVKPRDGKNISQDTLSAQQWKQLDRTVDRGLEYLAKQQQADGSFETLAIGQPGVTSLCVMAFLSRGHMPGQGQYGEQINRAVEFVLATQQENGILFDREIDPFWRKGAASHTGIYNHVISALMLTEAYGTTTAPQSDRIAEAIRNAIAYSLTYEEYYQKRVRDEGGFRYVRRLGHTSDSDVSITGWQLMFFRSAKNAEFEVPEKRVKAAMKYIKGCFNKRTQLFVYGQYGSNPVRPPSRGVQGAAVVSLSMGGEHQSEMAQSAAKWVLSQTFNNYNRSAAPKDRYHYSAFYCSQAMFQLGEEHWAQFFPEFMRTLASNQRRNGSWDREGQDGDGRFGHTYTTALAVMALTPPYQLLPIYQR